MSQRSAYLQALGIDEWRLRDSSAEIDAVDEVVPNATEEEPQVWHGAALPSFPAQGCGQFLIVCGTPEPHEGQGSAFAGEAAQLFDAMLNATQWPASECVLASQVVDLSATLQATGASLVVLLGEQAVHSILGAKDSIEILRQRIHRVDSASVIATYHPAQVVGDAAYKRPVWEDLKLAMSEAGG